MFYESFHNRFPEIAECETRAITLLTDNNLNLPPDSYAFVEMFCNEPGCDCRRVFFSVISSRSQQIEAVIAWGWEQRAFYAKWLGSKDPDMLSDLMGPVLNLTSPQSKFAPALLDLCKTLLLQDPDYIERVKRHYTMFRSAIDRKTKTGVRKKKKKSRK